MAFEMLYTSYSTGTIVIVIATSTIALQDQLMKDVRYLHEQLGIRLKLIYAKGQANYVCLNRAEEYLSKHRSAMAKKIAALIADGHQDRAEYPTDLPQEIWNQICITQYGPGCHRCHRICQYRRMRKELRWTTGIILCNQDLLTVHLLRQSRGQTGIFCDQIEMLVIDEAHNLESKVRNAVTERLSQSSLLAMIDQSQAGIPATLSGQLQREVQDAGEAVRAFFQDLDAQVRRQIEQTVQDMRYADRFFFSGPLDKLRVMVSALARLWDRTQVLSTYGPGQTQENASDGLGEVVDMLSRVLSGREENMLWIERKGRTTELVYCPRNVRDIIQELYFGGGVRTVMTSATLTNSNQGSLSNRYSYFIRNTGFPLDGRGCLSEPKPSPFPYDEHTMVYYCDDLPHPNQEHEAFLRQGTNRLVEILAITQGKALVLFTSKGDLDGVYEQLQQRNLPYKVLRQQAGSSQDQVLAEFKSNVNCVLLGTGAYWEGIDIKGKSLSSLVIFRLPFPVPDPIIEDKVSRAEDGLMDVRVPEMVIKLKQGVGRLIRSASDTGIVSIIDPRLRDIPPARYHDIVWSAIPIKNRTTSLETLRSFYDSLPEHPGT